MSFKTKGWKPPKGRKKATSEEIAEATEQYLSKGGTIKDENFWPPKTFKSENPSIPTPIIGSDTHNFLDEFDD